MTSHLAVISRGFSIPAVVGCGGSVDLKRRAYRLASGQLVSEFSNVLVDGRNGLVGFGDGEPRRRIACSSDGEQLISRTVELLDAMKFEQFKSLAVEDQLHIASLKSRLREMGRLQ